MVRTLLIRGMLVGAIAGLLAFGFSRIFGEPSIIRAIAFETTMEQAKEKSSVAAGMPAEVPHAELVSREMQAGLGLFTGVVVYCAAFGGIFSLVFAVANGRIGNLGPRANAALLAAGGFIAIHIVPSLKYPASPPAVGDAETIGQRTALYFILMAISIATMVGAIVLRKRLAPQQGQWSAALIASAGYIAAVVVAQIAMPAFDEVPDEFPAAVLWHFRVASLGVQLIMWTTIGLLFGWLTERATARRFAFAQPGQRFGSATR